MKIRALIAEDEVQSRERLKSLISEFPVIEVVGSAGSGDEAVKKISELKPDLLFLDIQMPGGNGFEVLKQIHYEPMVIFVTAYDQYAIQAFEENTIDYLLKPMSMERFKKAVNKVIKYQDRLNQNTIKKLELSMGRRDILRRLTVRQGDEIKIIPDEDIFYFKAEDRYVFIYLNQDRYMINTPLKTLEQKLDPARFCRIHKTYIISLDKIDKLKRWFNQEYVVYLKDKTRTKLKVSRHYKAILLKRIKFPAG